MNPIRIAHILPFPNIGGTEVATLRLAEALAMAGYESILFCPSGATELRQLFHDHSFVTSCYDQVEPSYHKPLPYLRATRFLAHELRRRQVRIVHCSDILAAHYAALAGRMAGAFVMSHVRCQSCDISLRDQSFLCPVQRFVFVSRQTRDTFAMRKRALRGDVLYDGIAMPPALTAAMRGEARGHYGIAPDAIVVGMASRVHPGKDFETLIAAAKIVVEAFPSCCFLIAGDYQKESAHREYYGRLAALIKDAGLCKQFVFAGFEEDMSRFYSAIDVFALSSHSEGFPLVLIEAMSYAKPVVATDVGGVSEAIVHNQSGLLVPHASPDKLAESLLRLLRNPEEARRMSEAARLHVEQKFSEQQFFQRVKSLYSSLSRRLNLMGESPACIST
jgi:glycosyltransferase involved in cell wall biosynthesis